MDPLLLSDNSVHEVRRQDAVTVRQLVVCAQVHLPGGSQGTMCQSWGKTFPLGLRSHHNLAMSYPRTIAPFAPGGVGAVAQTAEVAHYRLTAGCETGKFL